MQHISLINLTLRKEVMSMKLSIVCDGIIRLNSFKETESLKRVEDRGRRSIAIIYPLISMHGTVINSNHFYKTKLDLENYFYYPLPNRF